MFYPKLAAGRQQTLTTEAFGGYDHNLELADGEFYDMENLSADAYPLLAPRPRRGTAQAIEGVQGILAKDALCWVQNNTLYINGASMEAYMPSVSISAGEKQLISMGAYLCIFPDGIYFNTEKYSDNGYMGQENVVDAASSNVEISLCLVDGTALTVSYKQASQPENPTNGQYWLDTSGKLHTLKQWAEATSQWVSVPTVYLKLSANGIGKGFQQYDGIRLSGLTGNEQVEKLNGSQILYDVGESYIVIVGLVDETTKVTSGTVKTARKVPSMDFITESGNRLWGCKYGVADGETVNEIYCCKLGDFKNWNCFAGLSTDSYAASRGSDGKFTGAADYLGSPLFFKENCVERVYPSANGAHQIVTVQCPGVKDGSGGSLQVVDGKLYYHSQGGVCVFDGSMPVNVSQALGEARYHDAVAGAAEGCYYLSAADGAGAWHLLVLDTRQGLWYREDGVEALGFAPWGGDLYCLTAEGQLLAMKGAGETHEGPVQWMAETGELGLDAAESRYLVRLSLRLLPEAGSTVRAWLSYDEGGSWQPAGSLEGAGRVQACTLHIRPRRCRQLRLRLTGRGGCRIYSLSAVYEKGSDGP